MIHHIGIAVSSIHNSLSFYQDVLKFPLIKIENVESQGVKVAFFDAGNVKIELLEPLHEHSPIAKFIEKRGQGIHHLAVTEGDIEARLLQLKEEGYQLIDESPRIGADQNKIAFMHPKSTNGILLEWCQPKGE